MGTRLNKFKVLALCVALIYTSLLFVSSAQAKVDAFVTEDEDRILYQYEYKALLESYALSLMGAPAPLYEDYSRRRVKLVLDDVNAYVDYDDVLEAYAKSLLMGKSFDLDAYTSGTGAKIVTVDKVNVVSVDDGRLRIDEKVLSDPEEAALTEVNSAADASALRTILESRANVLSLDLEDYNTLFEQGKSAVASAVLERRGTGYIDTTQLGTVFAQEVQNALADVDHLLETLNSSASAQELEQLLLENGDVLELELDSYAMIISSRRGQAATMIFEAMPYETTEQLHAAFTNAVAAVLNSYVVASFTEYDLTVPGMVDIQMPLDPQWYVSGLGWRDAPREEVEYYVDPANFIPEDLADYVTEVIVAADVLNIRDIPGTEGSSVVASISKGQIYSVEDVREVTEGTAAGTEGYWFKITAGKVSGWVCGLFTDWVAENYSPQMFQFLTLSGSSGITAADLGNILEGRGILSGTEAVFHQASRDNDINEIFLTAMALHESGNGTSQLANGVLFTPEDPALEPRIVYNMYGIGAIDANPIYKGAEYAYNQGWFTPEQAISGGAYFVARNFVNNASYRQNTLYKIRWNPGSPGRHQYASDIRWALNQTGLIRQLYGQVSIYNLRFDIPWYKK